MSLGVVIKGPEGIVLAADSRVTLGATRPGMPPLPVNFDNATKLLAFPEPHNHVGAVTYGAAVIGLRTAHSYLPEFAGELQTKKRLTTKEYASALSAFFLGQWKAVMPEDYQGPPMTFIVGGYDSSDAYGKVFTLDIPNNPDPVQQNPADSEFGMTWGGQLEIASRLIQGYDPILPSLLQRELKLNDTQIAALLATLKKNLEFTIPYQVLPLQDCVDLARFMIKATMDAQNLSIGVRGVGGMIEIAVITRTNSLRYVQRKSLTMADEPRDA